jgi:hypothetical protein
MLLGKAVFIVNTSGAVDTDDNLQAVHADEVHDYIIQDRAICLEDEAHIHASCSCSFLGIAYQSLGEREHKKWFSACQRDLNGGCTITEPNKQIDGFLTIFDVQRRMR